MLILGLDLALSCGWCLLDDGVVEGCGTFKIKAPDEDRVGEVRWQRQCRRFEVWSAWLVKMREQYGHRLSSIVYEGIAPSKKHGRDRIFNHYALAGLVVVELGDVCPVAYIMPSSVKKALTGDGRADKDTVRTVVNEGLGLSLGKHEHDTSDAVAVAWTHYRKRQETAA